MNDPGTCCSRRVLRAAFVGLAVGLGWGIRGDFGHQLGAMVPGALLGLGLGYVSGQDKIFRMLPALGFVAAVTMSIGGTMSYGTLHGYAQSDSFINSTYGFLTLFLLGGVWGGPCGAGLGLLLEDKRPRFKQWLHCVTTVLVYGFLTYTVVVSFLHFHINPPRSDCSIGFMGGMAGLFIWLYKRQMWMGFKGALYGFIGFGLAMSLSRLAANISCIFPVIYDNWKIMEIGCGMIGGFVTSYALLGKELKSDSLKPWEDGVARVGLFFVMVGIPVLHKLQRLTPDIIRQDVAASAAVLRFENVDAVAARLHAFSVVILLVAVAGSFIWLHLYRRNLVRFSAFPVLWLAGTMLVIQNVKALFPFTHVQETIGRYRVGLSFWILFILMILFVAFWKRRPFVRPKEASENPRLGLAVVWSLAIFILMLAANAPVNHLAEKYGYQRPDGSRNIPRNSSNTRFPIGTYRDRARQR